MKFISAIILFGGGLLNLPSTFAQCDVNIDLNMAVPQSCSDKPGYILILADEFDNFNTSIWDKSYVGNFVGDYNHPDPDSLCIITDNTPMNESNVIGPDGGILKIRVRQGEEMNACDYSGGEIKTFNNGLSLRDWKIPNNSYVEVRVKIPHCSGVGAAFWLYGGVPGRFYEVDVFEYDSNDPDIIKANLHYGVKYKVNETTNLQLSTVCDLNSNDVNISERFLTFGVEMSNSSIKMYINNKIYEHYLLWPFEGNPYNTPVPFNIRLNSNDNPHVDDNKPGDDPSFCDNLPQYFEIDYVRVYQKSGLKAVEFIGATPGEVTLCLDKDCHGKDYCNWTALNYYPGAVYEWESSDLFYLINESAPSEDLQKFSVWAHPGTPPGEYQLKVTITFPCNSYKEELILKIKYYWQPPAAPNNIFLVTDDDYFFYPGVYTSINSASYEWKLAGTSIWHDVSNPPIGNKNIWDKPFKSTNYPRQVSICVRARNACGVSAPFCLTLTIPAKNFGCPECHRGLVPPYEIVVEKKLEQDIYMLGVVKSIYSESYEWSLDEIYWNDINNNASIAYNEFGPFEPGLDSFWVFVRAKNQDTLSAVLSQKVTTIETFPTEQYSSNFQSLQAQADYPNSLSKGEIMSDTTSSLYKRCTIYNTLGQIIQTGDFDSDLINNLRQSLIPGLYFIIISTKDSEKINVKKVLITSK